MKASLEWATPSNSWMPTCRRNFRPRSRRTSGPNWNRSALFLPSRGPTEVRALKEGKVWIKPQSMTTPPPTSRWLPRRTAPWFRKATSSRRADPPSFPTWISPSKTWSSSPSSPTRKLSYSKNRFCLLSRDRSSKNYKLKRRANLRSQLCHLKTFKTRKKMCLTFITKSLVRITLRSKTLPKISTNPSPKPRVERTTTAFLRIGIKTRILMINRRPSRSLTIVNSWIKTATWNLRASSNLRNNMIRID